jgi:hypothetical protein
MKIVVIIAYYGDWPKDYLVLFLKGLENNPMVDYLFITDNELPTSFGNQVKKIHLSFEELKKNINEKLDFNVNLKTVRKLCDIKPLYGYLFEEYIVEYDYWAYGDIDILLGDLNGKLPELLREYDVLTFHPYWISGPFTIFKNNDYCNQLFLKSKSIKDVLTNEKYIGFDECGNKYKHLEQGLDILSYKQCDDISHDIECMTFVISNEASISKLNFYQQSKIKEFILIKESINYNNGKLFFDNKEIFIYHFITEKQYYRFKFPKWKNIPSEFVIIHTGMYDIKIDKRIVKISYVYRIFKNELYRFGMRFFLSLNYRLRKKTIKPKYKIDVFR